MENEMAKINGFLAALKPAVVGKGLLTALGARAVVEKAAGQTRCWWRQGRRRTGARPRRQVRGRTRPRGAAREVRVCGKPARAFIDRAAARTRTEADARGTLRRGFAERQPRRATGHRACGCAYVAIAPALDMMATWPPPRWSRTSTVRSYRQVEPLLEGGGGSLPPALASSALSALTKWLQKRVGGVKGGGGAGRGGAGWAEEAGGLAGGLGRWAWQVGSRWR